MVRSQADGAAQIGRATSSDGLPDYYHWGDWAGLEPMATRTHGTGPMAAAANYLLSLGGLVHTAGTLGETDDAARFAAALDAGRRCESNTFLTPSYRRDV